MAEAFDFLQGEQSVMERIQADDYIRRNQQPKVPRGLLISTTAFQLSDGSTAAAITVSWSPVRPDMDYIVRWKTTGDAAYTYERMKISPHIIRPVATNVSVNVGIAAERRQYGTRSPFSDDAQLITAADTFGPDALTLSIGTNDLVGSIRLNWTISTAADLAYYAVYRSTSSGTEAFLSSTLATSYEDMNVTRGVTYFYYVIAIDRSGNNGAQSNEVNGAIYFVGTISVPPAATCPTDPPTGYSTAVSQSAAIPAGSRFLTVNVSVFCNTLVGASTSVTVRFSIDSSGTDTSQEVTLAFSAVSQTLQASLTSISPISATGTRNILYEWADTSANTSTFQLTSPGSIQITV